MAFDFFSFLFFAVPASISPGPNNISAMAFTMSLGYRRTLNYILGIGTGTFVIMLLCAWLSIGLFQLFPDLLKYLKFLGAGYIIYLSYKSLNVTFAKTDKEVSNPRFFDGMILQLVNPKAVFYGLTVYSTFFADLIDNKFIISLSALGLAIFTFSVVSLWAVFGNFIRQYLSIRWVKNVFGVAMAAGLVYAALTIVLS